MMHIQEMTGDIKVKFSGHFSVYTHKISFGLMKGGCMTKYAMKKQYNEAYIRNDWIYKSEFFSASP